MNYIKELNAFYDWLESNPCPSDAIALWHALVAICNKAGWPKEFTVANTTLQAKAGLSRQKLDRWRGFLIDKGLIKYKKSHRVNEAGKYEIVPFFPIVQNETRNDTQNDTQNSTRNDTQNDTQNSTRNEHINKLNKTKLNKTTSSNTDPFRLFESEGFGTISSFIAENIQDMIDTYGEVWVCEAMREAVLQGKRKLSYVRGILKSWAADGMKKQPDKSKTFAEQEIELSMRMRDRNEQPIDWFIT